MGANLNVGSSALIQVPLLAQSRTAASEWINEADVLG
jgi:hypothetical protein